ncbi:MAG: hydrogenase maturation nickel metallochaperone HypA [Candidatus Hodarchaeota archaeon]
MHEFSLAQSVFETILSVAQNNKVERIKAVKLKFGMFALIQEDQFRFCFDIIKSDSEVTSNSNLEISWIPGELQCLSCGFNGKIENVPQNHNELIPMFNCPSCKSYSTKIISGTELAIDSIIV